MKPLKYIYVLSATIILLIAFNNCNQNIAFRTEPSVDLLKSGDIIVGNPLVSKTLLAKMCKLMSSCHPDLSAKDCSDGIMKLSGVDFQLGLPTGTSKNYSDIVQAEENGQIHPNATAANTCITALEKLSCADPSVQGAYNPSLPEPFSGVAFMVPTATGSCPNIFNQPPARAEYFVSPQGSDLNDGSSSKPWATINHASNNLIPGPQGAIVHVAPGSYSPPTSAGCVVSQSYANSCGIWTTRSGTATAPIVYISDQTWGAKIIPADAYSAWYNSGDYVSIIGFEVVGNASTNIGIQSEGSFVHIENNHVHDVPVSLGCSRTIGGGGIVHTNETAHDNDSISNWVHDIGPLPGNGQPASAYCNHAHGIYHQQPRGKIQNNLVYRVGAWGIMVWYQATNMEITNNLVFESGSKNNMGNFLGGGIAMTSKTTLNDTTVSNNIIRNNSGIGLSDNGTTGTNNLISNNVFFANGKNFMLLPGTQVLASILVDPMMINFKSDGSGDYRLQSNSPALDQGSSNCALGTNCTPDRDASGFLRLYGAAMDIGPFEFHP
jgi:hypothetical protein